jgi:hypothetical protein
MLFTSLQPGVELKFPLTTKYSATKQKVNECSLGAETIAATVTSATNRGSACTFTWLPHAPGGVNYFEGDGEVVSGIFTGCVMSIYKVDGKRRVAHVHTGSDGAECCKAYFRGLLNGQAHSVVGNFKPYSGDRDLARCATIMQSSPLFQAPVLGLVSSDDKCYSVFLKKMAPNHFAVDSVIEQPSTLLVP